MTTEDHNDQQGSGSADARPEDSPPPDPDAVVVSTTDPTVSAGQTTRATKPKAAPSGSSQALHDDQGRPGWMGHVLTIVLATVCGVAGAWGYSTFGPKKDQEKDSSKQAKSDDDGSSSKKGSSNSQARKPDTAPSGDDGKIQEQIRSVSARYEEIRQRVDAIMMPRDPNPPDLTTLRIRLEDFKKAADGVKELPTQFKAIETRLDRLEQEIKGRHDRPVAETEMKSPEAKPPVEPSSPPPPSAVTSPSDGDLAAGMALFKEGKYPEAEAKFRELQRIRPEDARVWYFSALTAGLTTGQWDGEARTFVMEGANRERAGLPATALIDSAFVDLNAKSGKDWLASYRSQLIKR